IELLDLAFVLDVDVERAVAIGLRELGLAIQLYRSNDAIRVYIHRSEIIAPAIAHEEALGGRVIAHGVRTGTGRHTLQLLKSLEIEHKDRVVAAEADVALA